VTDIIDKMVTSLLELRELGLEFKSLIVGQRIADALRKEILLFSTRKLKSLDAVCGVPLIVSKKFNPYAWEIIFNDED